VGKALVSTTQHTTHATRNTQHATRNTPEMNERETAYSCGDGVLLSMMSSEVGSQFFFFWSPPSATNLTTPASTVQSHVEETLHQNKINK
jgi:hypothetical protein